MQQAKIARLLSVICAILMGATGVAVMLFLKTSGRLCWTVVGAVLILVGLTKSFSYFSEDLYDLAFQFDLSLGILVAMAGLSMILHPDFLMNFFPFIAGALTVADCGFKLQVAMDARRFGLLQWRLLAIAAAFCTAAGIALMLCTVGISDLWALLSGIVLLADGMLNLLTVLLTVRIPTERSKESCINLEKES